MGHRGATGGGPPFDAGERKALRLLAGDFLLYEVTATRELRVLRFPRPLTTPAGSGDPPSPTGGADARPRP